MISSSFNNIIYSYKSESSPLKRQKCDKRIAAELKRDSAHIQKIYENDFVAAGDKARMKLALFSPKVYGCVTRIYDKLVVPVKAAIKK